MMVGEDIDRDDEGLKLRFGEEKSASPFNSVNFSGS